MLKAGPWPRGPRPTARDGPAARGPEARSAFSTVFYPAVNPRACTDLHRVWACKMDDGEFEFGYHFNNHFNPFFPCMLLSEKRCHSLFICLFTEPDREEDHSQAM